MHNYTGGLLQHAPDLVRRPVPLWSYKKARAEPRRHGRLTPPPPQAADMCDLGGCCNDDREYEWMPNEEPGNKAAVEAMRRQTYSRDIELPEFVDRGGGGNKRIDTVLDLGDARRGSKCDASTRGGGSGGGSVFRRGDKQTATEQDEPEAAAREPSRVEAFSTGEGQRLGGESLKEVDANARAKEAALKRMEAAPQGFSAKGSAKMRQAAK